MTSTEDFVVRRVVTGVDESHRSTVVEDATGRVRADTPIASMVTVAQFSGLPVDASTAVDTGVFAMEPARGGVTVTHLFLPPDSQVDQAAYEEVLRGLDAESSNDSEPAGMHQTNTVDVFTLISGRVFCLLENGEVELGPGDSMIQRATRHAWRNRSSQPAHAVVVLLSADAGASPS